MTGIQQIAMMRGLRQQAAAALIGISARALRDHVDAPRREDGTYDALELVRWWFTSDAERLAGALLEVWPDDADA